MSQKALDPDDVTEEFYKTFKQQVVPLFYKFFQSTEKGKVCNSFYEISITLIPKPDEDIQRKKNYRSLSLMNANVKF